MKQYTYDLKDYTKAYPDYLRNPGNDLMLITELYYDIMNNYKDQIITFWKHLDLNTLESSYIRWLRNDPLPGEKWQFTELVEGLCKTYGITREHPVGRLNERHLIRLLKIKTSGISFDGTRKRIEEIYENIFPNMNFLFISNNSVAASANIYLFKSDSILEFDEIDEALFKNGYYFIDILGISFEFYTVNRGSLIYDYTNYTEKTTPKGEETYYDNKEGN